MYQWNTYCIVYVFRHAIMRIYGCSMHACMTLCKMVKGLHVAPSIRMRMHAMCACTRLWCTYHNYWLRKLHRNCRPQPWTIYIWSMHVPVHTFTIIYSCYRGHGRRMHTGHGCMHIMLAVGSEHTQCRNKLLHALITFQLLARLLVCHVPSLQALNEPQRKSGACYILYIYGRDMEILIIKHYLQFAL